MSAFTPFPGRALWAAILALGTAAAVPLARSVVHGAVPLESPGSRVAHASDSAAVAAAVTRYHQALATGDSSAALELLMEDAIILESGAMETRSEYRAHHLPADIQFARAVKTERGTLRVNARGDVAWAASTSTARGEYRGRQIDSRGAELMVLVRGPEGWKIGAIHWSSRARPGAR